MLELSPFYCIYIFKQFRPRSEGSYRSPLIWVWTVRKKVRKVKLMSPTLKVLKILPFSSLNHSLIDNENIICQIDDKRTSIIINCLSPNQHEAFLLCHHISAMIWKLRYRDHSVKRMKEKQTFLVQYELINIVVFLFLR